MTSFLVGEEFMSFKGQVLLRRAEIFKLVQHMVQYHRLVHNHVILVILYIPCERVVHTVIMPLPQ